jgi:hypothetical protein
MKQEVSKYTDWDAHVMQAIAQAENRSCNPARHNLTASETHRRADGSVICVGSYGVLQVGCLHYSASDDINDLATNIKIAHRLWQNRQQWGNGYQAWTMFNNGTYKEFL